MNGLWEGWGRAGKELGEDWKRTDSYMTAGIEWNWRNVTLISAISAFSVVGEGPLAVSPFTDTLESYFKLR